MFSLILSISLYFPSYTRVDDNVFDKGLVDQPVNLSEVLLNYNEVSSEDFGRYASKGKQVLGFITPWNQDGYGLSEEFGDKFTIIVPTWFFAEIQNKKFVIKGEDAVNQTWLDTMREKHPNTLIAPRLIFQINPNVFYNENKFIFNVFRQAMADIITKYNFDAIFLEVPSYVANPQTVHLVPGLVKEIRVAFGKKKKGKVFCEIPTILRGYLDYTDQKLIKKIADQADLVYMSIYELPQTSAISPMSGFEQTYQWLIQSGIKKEKFLAGFPFFGFDYGNGSGREYVVGNDFINTLKNYKVSRYFLQEYQETAYFYKKDKASHTMYYPSLNDMVTRYDRVVTYGIAGFGIWELAQGLPFFFDVL